MEELFELRTYLENQDYAAALALIGEMEEMSKDDKRRKIYSYTVVVLLHLIKQHAEQRTTRSWDFSIRNAVREIQYINKRRKAGGWYFSVEELAEIVQDAYPSALDRAALEAFEGQYNDAQLAEMVAREEIQRQAHGLLVPATQQ